MSMDKTMDSYVIRIYRRNSEDRQVVGLVEIISSQEQLSFRTFDELREILQPANTKGAKKKEKGNNPGQPSFRTPPR